MAEFTNEDGTFRFNQVTGNYERVAEETVTGDETENVTPSVEVEPVADTPEPEEETLSASATPPTTDTPPEAESGSPVDPKHLRAAASFLLSSAETLEAS